MKFYRRGDVYLFCANNDLYTTINSGLCLIIGIHAKAVTVAPFTADKIYYNQIKTIPKWALKEYKYSVGRERYNMIILDIMNYYKDNDMADTDSEVHSFRKGHIHVVKDTSDVSKHDANPNTDVLLGVRPAIVLSVDGDYVTVVKTKSSDSHHLVKEIHYKTCVKFVALDQITTVNAKYVGKYIGCVSDSYHADLLSCIDLYFNYDASDVLDSTMNDISYNTISNLKFTNVFNIARRYDTTIATARYYKHAGFHHAERRFNFLAAHAFINRNTAELALMYKFSDKDIKSIQQKIKTQLNAPSPKLMDAYNKLIKLSINEQFEFIVHPISRIMKLFNLTRPMANKLVKAISDRLDVITSASVYETNSKSLYDILTLNYVDMSVYLNVDMPSVASIRCMLEDRLINNLKEVIKWPIK